jgi:hypothetical protein
LAGSCECGDEPSGSGATELVSSVHVVARGFKGLLLNISQEINTATNCNLPNIASNSKILTPPGVDPSSHESSTLAHELNYVSLFGPLK